MKRLAPSTAMLLGIALWPSFATAQNTPADPRHVDTRASVDSGDDPRSPTSAVSTLELRAPYDSSRDLAEKLVTTPGFHARRTSFGQSAFATIRGSGSRQVHVEWEGLRLNPPFGPGYDLGSTSLLGFDEVAVIRGPAATYRGGALAGAIEFRTRHLRRSGYRAVFSGLGGSFGTLAGSADANVATDNASTRIAVAGRASDGAFSFEDKQGTQDFRVNNAHERSAMFASSELRRADTTVRLTATRDRGSRGTPGQSEFQDQFRFATLADSRELALGRVETTGLFSSSRATLDGFAAAGAQRRTLHYTNPEPFLAGPAIDESTTSVGIHARTGAILWLPTTVLRAATDVRAESWLTDDFEADRVSGGFGASLEQSFFDRAFVAFASARIQSETGTGTTALPSIGARWLPAQWLEFTANAGRTHRAPDLDELFLDTESLRGDPSLEPERAWAADVGAQVAFGRSEAGLVAFARDVSSSILFLPVSAYLVQATNVEGARVLGAEAIFGTGAGPLAMDLTYTLTDSRFRQTADPVPIQPRHRGYARLSGDASLPEDHPWRVADRVEVWTSADVRSRVYLDVFGNQSARGYAFWDVGTTFGGDGWDFTIEARNVLDDNGAVDSLQQPLPGRSFWASLLLQTGSS